MIESRFGRIDLAVAESFDIILVAIVVTISHDSATLNKAP